MRSPDAPPAARPPARRPTARPPAARPSAALLTAAARPSAGVRCVARRMRALGAALPDGDGVAVFNRVYLSVTEEVARRIDGGAFGDSPGVARLSVLFARRYLAAVRADAAGRPVPASWRPLLSARRRPGIRPLQFALAGINAHVGHDLALAVLDTCRALAVEPEAVREDFERVGGVLAAIEVRVREELMPGPDPLERAEPLTHLVGCWSLARARDAAWTASRLLWGLRGHRELRAEFVERLDAGVGMVGRCLLTPLGEAAAGQVQLECSGLPSA